MAKPRPFIPRAGAPIPQRFPALAWRRPAVLWTPLALLLALGWPAWAVSADRGMMQFALIVGACGFALAFLSLGAAWITGKPPKTRRAVMEHVLLWGGVAALVAPFLVSSVLGLVANAQGAGEAPALPPGMAMSLLPLTLVIGLPMAYVAGLAFSCVALVKPVKAAHAADPDPPRPDPIDTYSAAYDDAFN
jgi:hypothetical protein